MKLWIIVALTFLLSPLYALDCGPDLAARDLVERWARSGADLHSADLYEVDLLDEAFRVPFLFPEGSSLSGDLYNALLTGTKSVYWRSGRDIKIETGMVAFSDGDSFESSFPITEENRVVDGLQREFAREFRMVQNGLARPIVQILYPPSLELTPETRNLLERNTRVATSIRLVKTNPIAVIFWGGEYLPAGNSGAVSMLDSLVSVPHRLLMRQHLFPVVLHELDGGSVYPTIESTFLLRAQQGR